MLCKDAAACMRGLFDSTSVQTERTVHHLKHNIRHLLYRLDRDGKRIV
jgi:hypothetical protein